MSTADSLHKQEADTASIQLLDGQRLINQAGKLEDLNQMASNSAVDCNNSDSVPNDAAANAADDDEPN